MPAGDDGTIFRGAAFVEIDANGNIVLQPDAGSVIIDGTDYSTKADLTGAGGVLVSSQVPDLAITETYVVADQTARLALSVQEGDVAIQQDNDNAYIFTGGDPTIDANWSLFAVVTITDRAINPSEISNQDYNESVESSTAVSGTLDVDLSLANWHEFEADGNVTVSFSNVTTTPSGNSVVLYFSDANTTGPHTISWPASVTWSNGTIRDTIPQDSDLEVTLRSPDGGTTWRASKSGGDFA